MIVQRSLFFITLVSQIQCNTDPSDVDVLKELYGNTSSQGWVTEWSFETDNSYLTLNGITWNSEKSNVESINLTLQNLGGKIPDSFTTLTKLIWVEMVGNNITYIPDLSTMSTLRDVNLTLNKIADYTGGFHVDIVNISLANNSLSNVNLDLLDNLVSSTSIRSVNLKGNALSGSLSGILDNDNIEALDLSSNDLSGSVTPSTKNLTGWTFLSLGWNNFTGSYPTAYKGLDTVDLRCNKFDCENLTNATGWGVGECLCPDKGYYAKIQDDASVKCTVCPNGSIANKWVRIELPDVETDYYCSGPTTTTECQQCFYPSNCVDGGCKGGATGPTCEKCKAEFRMIGGECEECHSTKIPFSAVVLLVIVVVIVGYGVFLTGLNIVSATMIKQLFSYLQIFHLTMDIRAPWPRYMSELGDIYKFSMLNTQAIQLECYGLDLSTASLFYINWATAVGWPILTTIIVTIICKSLSARIHKLEHSGSEIFALKAEDLRKSQTGIRRVYVLFMIIAFVPITSLSIRTFACETWIGSDYTLAYNDGAEVVQNQFFYDNEMSCWDYTFQGINFLATIFVVTEAGILVFLFLLLFRLWKFNEKDKHNEYFGALYESFKPSGLFCEPVIMFRKFILILTTQLMYLTPFIAGLVNAVVSCGWLLAVCILRPYKSRFEYHTPLSAASSQYSPSLRNHHPTSHEQNNRDSPIEQLPGAMLSNWCNLFEIFSTLMILVIHILAMTQGDTLNLWESFNLDVMDYTLFTLNIFLLLVWVLGFCYVLVKHTRTDIKERRSLRTRRNTIRLNTINRETTEDFDKDEAISIFEEKEEFDSQTGASTGNPVVIVNDAGLLPEAGRGSRGSLELTNHQ